MKFGSFLIGGIVGAAAVVYLNSKSKSMLLSAFSSNNQSVGNVIDKAKDRFTNVFDNQNAQSNTASQAASASSASQVSSTAVNNNNKQSQADLGKVKEIVSKEPKLNGAVNEILHENHQNEVHRNH